MLPKAKAGVNTQQGLAHPVRWHRGWAGWYKTCGVRMNLQGSPIHQAVEVYSKLPAYLTGPTPARCRIVPFKNSLVLSLK